MKRKPDPTWMWLAGLGLGATLAYSIVLNARRDPIFMDYLLNTFVNKIPFPELRMAFYRFAGMKVDRTSNIMMYTFVLQARDISIGPNCIIGPFTTLDGRATLTIGRNVNVAGEVLTIGGYGRVQAGLQAADGPNRRNIAIDARSRFAYVARPGRGGAGLSARCGRPLR